MYDAYVKIPEVAVLGLGSVRSIDIGSKNYYGSGFAVAVLPSGAVRTWGLGDKGAPLSTLPVQHPSAASELHLLHIVLL